jgi:hypothetical protein
MTNQRDFFPRGRNMSLSSSRRLFIGLAAVAVLGVLPFGASAGVINIGFETGGFGEWSTLGADTVETKNFGIAPPAGVYQALIQNHVSGFDGIPVGTLESFLDLPTGKLSSFSGETVTQGSGIQRTVNANAGDPLKFSYVFLTNEDANPNLASRDFLFVSIDGQLFRLADPSSAVFPAPFTAFDRYSLYFSFDYTFTTSGSHTIGIGVVDVDDKNLSSAALISDVLLTTDALQVPEPSSVTLLAIALPAMLVYRLSRFRRGKT